MTSGHAPQSATGPSWSAVPAVVPVANRAPVAHALASMRELGIAEPVVLVDDALADAVRVAAAPAATEDARWIEVEAPAAAVDALAELATGADDAWLIWHADGVFVGDVFSLVRRFAAERPAALLTTHTRQRDRDTADHAAPDLALRLEADRVVSVEVSPLDDASLVPVAGITIVGRPVLDRLAALRPSWRGRRELGAAIAGAFADGEMIAAASGDGWWPCRGGADDLLEANRAVLDHMAFGGGAGWMSDSELSGRVFIHPTAAVEASTIRGPAVIGAGARIRDTYIGPYTSVGDAVTLDGCEIEDSIVCSGARVDRIGTRIDRSLIGPRARLVRAMDLPRTLRVWVGERTEVAFT